jgi:aminopeptidase N
VPKDPWIRKIGFPVVTVAEEPSQISIRQNRFLSTGDAKPEEDETTWWIPLGIKSGPRMENVESRALVSKADTVHGVGQDSFYKINKDLSGFYRTNYPAERLARLGKYLELLSTEDKIGLIGDAAALAVSGESSTAALLALLEGFKEEENYLLVSRNISRIRNIESNKIYRVWSQISSSLANLRSVFSQNELVATGLKKFALKLASPAADRIGWEFKSDDDYLTAQLRKLLIGMVGFAGDEK